jgi:ribosomal protein S18 acetylase RimI-like enzyme
MSNVIIRIFAKKDRPAVRAIACDTADRGEAIERLFPDREFAADLLTAYYTDFEPQSTFIAEDQGRVVGYIQGSFDNRRYGLVFFWILIPKFLCKAFKRGLFFRKDVWRIIKTAFSNWPRLFTWRQKSFHSHEGHIHIGIVKEFRGQHVGQKLVGTLAQYAKTQGVDLLTASVHDGNAEACRFFEHLGFSVRERHPMVMTRGSAIEHYNGLLYAKKIS